MKIEPEFLAFLDKAPNDEQDRDPIGEKLFNSVYANKLKAYQSEKKMRDLKGMGPLGMALHILLELREVCLYILKQTPESRKVNNFDEAYKNDALIALRKFIANDDDEDFPYLDKLNTKFDSQKLIASFPSDLNQKDPFELISFFVDVVNVDAIVGTPDAKMHNICREFDSEQELRDAQSHSQFEDMFQAKLVQTRVCSLKGHEEKKYLSQVGLTLKYAESIQEALNDYFNSQTRKFLVNQPCQGCDSNARNQKVTYEVLSLPSTYLCLTFDGFQSELVKEKPVECLINDKIEVRGKTYVLVSYIFQNKKGHFLSYLQRDRALHKIEGPEMTTKRLGKNKPQVSKQRVSPRYLTYILEDKAPSLILARPTSIVAKML